MYSTFSMHLERNCLIFISGALCMQFLLGRFIQTNLIFHHREYNILLISDYRLMCSTTQVRRLFLCCCTESLFFFFFSVLLWLVFVHLQNVLLMHINIIPIIEELQTVVTLNMRASCQFCWSSLVYLFNDTVCPYK